VFEVLADDRAAARFDDAGADNQGDGFVAKEVKTS